MYKFQLILGLLVLLTGCQDPTPQRKTPEPILFKMEEAQFQRGDSVTFKNYPKDPMVVQAVNFNNAVKEDDDGKLQKDLAKVRYLCKFKTSRVYLQRETYSLRHDVYAMNYDTAWFYQYELEKYEPKGEIDE